MPSPTMAPPAAQAITGQKPSTPAAIGGPAPTIMTAPGMNMPITARDSVMATRKMIRYAQWGLAAIQASIS